MRRKLLLILLICVLLLIWGQSCLPADLSDQESGRIFELIRPFLELFLGKGRVTHHLVRKLAHFCEFFALGFLAAFLFPMDWKRRLLCCGFCLFAALVDETIQVFSDRGDKVPDIWLDFSGALLGIILITLLRWLVQKRRLRAGSGTSKAP